MKRLFFASLILLFTCLYSYADTEVVGIVGVGGVLNVNTTQYQTPADTVEHDAASYTLPANTLNADHKIIRVTAFGHTANNANYKRVRLYFDNVEVILHSEDAVDSGWQLVGHIIRTGVGTQKIISTSSMNDDTASKYVDTTADETAEIIIKITVHNNTAAAADTVYEGMIVELLN